MDILIYGYLIASLILAVVYVRYDIAYDKTIADVPAGDLENYEKKYYVLDYVLWVFPISIAMIAAIYGTLILFHRD